MLEGTTVIITGGAMGIGRYMSHTFAEAGANLVIADIASTEEVAAEVAERGAQVLTLEVDVQDEAQVQDMVARAVDRFGSVDVMVPNAAIVPHFRWGVPLWPRLKEMETSFWDKVINTTFRGTVICTKAVLPQMEAQGGGHVVTLYGGGAVTDPGAGYVVSKEAIRTFTRFIAEEERPYNVCLVCVNPGAAIATENAPEEAKQRMPGPDFVGNRFVLAAQVGMEMSGKLFTMSNGLLMEELPRLYQ